MLKYALPIVSAVLCLSAATLAHADEGSGAWTMSDAGVRVAAAGIAVPTAAASLSLLKTGEFSNGGKSIDNYAQYVSDDGAIQATVYIYLPTYADAAISAYMTDRAIMDRFGNQTRRSSYGSVAAGSQPGTAIRAIYDDAGNGQLTTAAALIHAGRWMVKLRVTGPSDQRDAVIAGVDAMLAGLHVDNGTMLHAATPPTITACPTAATTDAQPVIRRSLGQSGSASQPNFPRDGKDALCIRGKIQTADGSFDMLQATDGTSGSILVPMDDTGTVMAFDPVANQAGYRLSIHSVGKTDVFTAYDRLPSMRQIAAMLEGTDPATAHAHSTTAHAANGTIRVTMRGQ